MELVKQLRTITGAPIVDCKDVINKILAEQATTTTSTEFDFQKAIDLLRKKGVSTAAKKANRSAQEGLIALRVSPQNDTGVLVELNCETDFVARNDKFQQMTHNVSQLVSSAPSLVGEASVTELLQSKIQSQQQPDRVAALSEELTQLTAVTGENCQLGRAHKVSVAPAEGRVSVISGYVHNAVGSPVNGAQLGRIGVLVVLSADKSVSRSTLCELGEQTAMHVAAANPLFLSKDTVPAEALNKEKEIILEQIKQSGKAAMADKMIAGRLQKFVEETALQEQTFLIVSADAAGKPPKVKDYLTAQHKSITVDSFVKYRVGERN